MVTTYLPTPRLVLLGAVHIAQELAPMAIAAGFEVTVVDPRSAFAAPQRLPGIRVFAAWPQDALPEIGLDHYTAFYVGALGSRKTHGRRLERLKEGGVGDDALASIHAPIGLEIGARTPAEIAVATLAEIIRSKTARRPRHPEASA